MHVALCTNEKNIFIHTYSETPAPRFVHEASGVSASERARPVLAARAGNKNTSMIHTRTHVNNNLFNRRGSFPPHTQSKTQSSSAEAQSLTTSRSASKSSSRGGRGASSRGGRGASSSGRAQLLGTWEARTRNAETHIHPHAAQSEHRV